jgi:hypothetical protein
MSSTLYVRGVVVFLYAGSRRLLHNLTNMYWKALVHFSIHVAIVRGHPSTPLLPLFLTMSICIPHGLYNLTTPVPL